MKNTAAVFAGQGAQYVGMGKDLVEAFPSCKKLFDDADRILGFPISKVCFEGPEAELTRTDRCQPAIFLVSAACWTALREQYPSFAPVAVAGLSLGEWSALYAAGVVSFEDTLRILEARGKFMQEACDAQAGGMVSIMGLTDEQLAGICQSAGVQVSNANAPGQTVLSGAKDNVAKAEQLAKEAGAKKIIPLKVAGAYHSRLMEPAARKLAGMLATVNFKQPSLPVYSNVTGRVHGNPEEIKAAMVSQVTSTVRWADDVAAMQAAGMAGYVEMGPGRVLSGMIGRVHAGAAVSNVQDKPSLEKTVAALSAQV